MQGLLSSHTVATPGLQTPPLQASPVVHALLSLQGSALLIFTQPLLASQMSVVQGLPSSQTFASPPEHEPPWQVSPSVQTFLSLHGALLLVATQPFLASQASVVQGLPSSQGSRAPGWQAPLPHWSPWVQRLPSLHGWTLLLKTQPNFRSQLSSVQGLPSLHCKVLPALHCPPAQTSPKVQMLSSLHAVVLLVDLQPPLASQVSVVQLLPSSQGLGAAGVQVPLMHASPVVQLLLSSHAAVLLVNWQPWTGSQLSSVHGLPSLHGKAPLPTQTPALQTSTMVHKLLSVQVKLLATKVQPSLASQPSVVHRLPSSQTVAAPGKHMLLLHKSPTVQTLLSLQLAVSSGTEVQPLTGSQLSVVHGLPSSQTTDVPKHFPLLHSSPLVQALPSSQGPGLAGCWHSPLTQLS